METLFFDTRSFLLACYLGKEEKGFIIREKGLKQTFFLLVGGRRWREVLVLWTDVSLKSMSFIIFLMTSSKGNPKTEKIHQKKIFTKKTFATMMARSLALLLLLPLAAWACTDVLVTPEASEDGSAMIAYNADSASLMGILYHYPPTEGKGNEERRIYEWDTGVSLHHV